MPLAAVAVGNQKQVTRRPTCPEAAVCQLQDVSVPERMHVQRTDKKTS